MKGFGLESTSTIIYVWGLMWWTAKHKKLWVGALVAGSFAKLAAPRYWTGTILIVRHPKRASPCLLLLYFCPYFLHAYEVVGATAHS